MKSSACEVRFDYTASAVHATPEMILIKILKMTAWKSVDLWTLLQ